jgi:hypothetical protein
MRTKQLLEETVRRNSSRKLAQHHRTMRHSTLLRLTPRMDILGFTLVYIYTYVDMSLNRPSGRFMEGSGGQSLARRQVI